jgi:hypothetical protein
VSRERRPDIGPGEFSLYLEVLDIERVESEYIVMEELVIPWGSRAVIAVIVSLLCASPENHLV